MSHVPDGSTHASRNPTKMVQDARGHKKGTPLTDAEKASRKAAALQRKIDSEAFNAELEAFSAYRAQTAVELAAKYNKTFDYMARLLGNASQFKKTREVTLYNALVHDVGRQAKAAGEVYHLDDLHAMAREILETNPPDEAEAAELIATCRDAREARHVGLRASNKAAAVDARETIAHLQDEVRSQHFSSAPGTRCVAFVSRGHLSDSVMPAVLQSGDAANFCLEVLKRDAVDVLQLFEQYSCARSSAKIQRDNRQSMCAETATMIEEKLRALTRCDTLRVSYAHMDVDIREPYGCEISGWPSDIPIEAPAKIQPMERLRRIRNGWASGEILWVTMTTTQIKELAVEMEARRKESGGVLKKRKPRKDVGATRSSKDARSKDARKAKGKGKRQKKKHAPADSDSEDEGLARKKKQPRKKRAHTDSDSEEDEAPVQKQRRKKQARAESGSEEEDDEEEEAQRSDEEDISATVSLRATRSLAAAKVSMANSTSPTVLAAADAALAATQTNPAATSLGASAAPSIELITPAGTAPDVESAPALLPTSNTALVDAAPVVTTPVGTAPNIESAPDVESAPAHLPTSNTALVNAAPVVTTPVGTTLDAPAFGMATLAGAALVNAAPTSAVPMESAGVPFATTFIAYNPLGNISNSAPRKRKVADDREDGAPAKKRRARKDSDEAPALAKKAVRPAPRPKAKKAKAAGEGSSTLHRPGSVDGYAARATARTQAALVAQLPPRSV
ncbi:hypothetical protein B0H15DRAFT_807545 [Mycena belliarum]|uniref:Uncharacterized protein n=1 Tax=Mycena belliarum TaxID=1033014 RepID=A0AAD6TKR5_9AGAR|nr:hypothetical protein B0H15DRAFT_807545 [Mycena belliae]